MSSQPPVGDAGSFRTLLRQLRLAAGLTQQQLALRAQLPVRRIREMERGVHMCLHEETMLLAEALGLRGEAYNAFLASAPWLSLSPSWPTVDDVASAPASGANLSALVAHTPSVRPRHTRSDVAHARPLPSGTVTFLFTDIAGSTRLLRQLRERYGQVLALQRELLRRAVAAHGGTEVDNQGDAFFFAFPRARDALAAAAAAQRGLANYPWPEGTTVRVRMGLHTGEPDLGQTGYVGIDVVRAARIAAAGHGGQVLLSAVTRELVEGNLPSESSLRDLGEHRLKDLPRPERITQLVFTDLPDMPADFPPLKTLDAPSSQGAAPPAVHTFLMADVAGYARFTEEQGDEAAAHLTMTFAHMVREGIEPHGGHLVELAGDQALVVFASSKRALCAALELQARFTTRAAQDPMLPLHVRMGLDAGEAVAVEGGFRGLALNRASRLCSLAGPGEVLASDAVVHLAHKVNGMGYVPRTPVPLSGFADPQAVFQIVSAPSAADTVTEGPHPAADVSRSAQ